MQKRGISAQNYVNISGGSPGAPRSSVPPTQTSGFKRTESVVTDPDAKRYGLAAKNPAQRLAVADPMGVAIRSQGPLHDALENHGHAQTWRARRRPSGLTTPSSSQNGGYHHSTSG